MLSDIYFADRNFSCVFDKLDYERGIRKYEVVERLQDRSFRGETNLGGDYQAKNLQAVFQASRILQKTLTISDYNISEGIRKVVANTHLAGRWHIRGTKPLLIFDTGHNKEGIEYIVHQIKKLNLKKLHMVIGFVSDKDLSTILPLFPAKAQYYFTKADVPRALDEKVLREKAALYDLKGQSYADVKSAIRAARSNASEEDLIFVGGSNFIVADAL
jgi:dihydrofolate synthase/folylpolyglutamate synthase